MAVHDDSKPRRFFLAHLLRLAHDRLGVGDPCGRRRAPSIRLHGFFSPDQPRPGAEPRRNLACLLPLLGDALRWQLWLFTSFYTLLDASFPIVWATVGDFYGRKYFATIRGMLSFFYMWGSVAGPVLAGAIYDRSQSYTRVMWGLFLVLAVATLLNALLIKPWRRYATAAQLNN